MAKQSSDVKLYNILFPFWMLMLLPPLWLIILPGNFLIDSLVLIVSMYLLKLAGKKQLYKRWILPIFCFGLLSDMIGSAYMILMLVWDLSSTAEEWHLTLPALILAGISIFLLNYFITFRKTDRPVRLKLALTFAIVTAPYTFMVPSSWLYG